MAVAAERATGRSPDSGLRGKLWVAFVVQLAAISVATALSVFGAWLVLREVLIQRALSDETTHYWQRLERDPGAELPDTYNMKSYFAPAGSPGAVPPALQPLTPGYHSAMLRGKDDLVYVSDGPGGRLYLVFDQEQVDRLAFWFGFVPLSVVLLVIYSTTWFTYRVSRRAVSPVIWLATQVREWDSKNPDFRALAPDHLPREADTDMRVLAESLHGFGMQIEEFVERERNFTRDASHELRTPLTLVKVAADVLLSDGELTAFAERSVLRIKGATRDMEALIESFLILARAGDVGLPDDDFIVNAVAAEEIDKARTLLEGKSVEVELIENAQFALHAPARVFEVMLANLLRNACAYTERGRITVTIGADSVSVGDTGVGMTPEQLARAFELYDRAGRTGDRGYGIGLTIVKRLSERFGWPIELASEAGVGTTATLRFPNPQPL